jgi:signal transduction histidine kinase
MIRSMNQQPRPATRATHPPAAGPGWAGRPPRPGWPVLLGCAGVVGFAAFLWVVEHTSPPPLPAVVVVVGSAVGLLVGPWAYLAARRLRDDAAAGRVLRGVLVVGAALAAAGVALAVAVAGGAGDPDAAGSVAMFAILVAGLLALVGLVVLPWLFLLARMVTRERAARVRAEERAEVATHLHDSVLQTLTLIQKRTGDPAAMARLARHAERELRAWLSGPDADGGGDDLMAALRAAAAEVEDRFGVSVEVVTVGSCPLDDATRAVLGAAREALVNAAKHAGVAKVSLFAEVTGELLLVAVRDRGRGFDQAAAAAPDRHGIAGSIVGRVGRHGGTATIRTAPGSGTEVELRLPLGTPR